MRQARLSTPLRTLREEMLTLRRRDIPLEVRQKAMRAVQIHRGFTRGPSFAARVQALAVGREVCRSVWLYLTWTERLEVLAHYERKSAEYVTAQEVRKMEALG